MLVPTTPAQLTERRRALGITQEKLAEFIRIDRVNVARWECGMRPLPLRRAEQLDATLTALEVGYQLAREMARRAAGDGA